MTTIDENRECNAAETIMLPPKKWIYAVLLGLAVAGTAITIAYDRHWLRIAFVGPSLYFAYKTYAEFKGSNKDTSS